MRNLPDLFFGSIALKNKMLNRETLAQALREQDARAMAGEPLTLGEVCLALGLLAEEQVNAVLWAQGKSEVLLEDTLCGRIAVRNKLVSDDDLKDALLEQARRGPGTRVGAILVERGKITEQELAAILRAQKRLHAVRPWIGPPTRPTIVAAEKPLAPDPAPKAKVPKRRAIKAGKPKKSG